MTMSESIQRRAPIEIRIPDAPLRWKLNAISATLVAVRDAHRDTMSVRAWAAINRALDQLGEAELTCNEGRALPEASDAPKHLPL